MIRTIIVDDEILSRIGLRSFIDGKEGIVVSGIFGEAAEAIKYLEENVVDVVLTDIEMTDINGLELIRYIREKHLAAGVIIISCHDDFSYAQQAISLGTDSYILKHSVTEEKLISEVKKVYEKTVTAGNEKSKSKMDYHESADIKQECIYRVAVLQMETKESLALNHEQQRERDMLVHLLEEIVSRYQMGTLFAPYNREIFILFQMEKEKSEKEREEILMNWISLLEKNTRQYITGNMVYGLSQEYENLADTRGKYENAVIAAEQYFYHQDRYVFYYRQAAETGAFPFFSVNTFLEKDWPSVFERELETWMDQADRQQIAATVAKQMLIQNLKQMIHHIQTEYNFSEQFEQKWTSEMSVISDISVAKNCKELKNVVFKHVQEFHEGALRESIQNPLVEVLKYIEQHLEEKLSLPELADMAFMSVPSFCKKFKDQTGMTVTQYLNEKRIERAKVLLKQQKYTLWEIAEMTGFSNANYLLRVFKKTTGQTISEYRKGYGIWE